MAYLEELLPKFRKGARIRRSEASKPENGEGYVYYEDGKIYDEFGMQVEPDVGLWISKNDWELYEEPQPNWEHIIKNRCFCWFWDSDMTNKSIGFLKDWIKGANYPFLNELNSIYYVNCRPIFNYEANFYRYEIGELIEKNGRRGIYVGEYKRKPLILALKNLSKLKNWDNAMENIPAGWKVPNHTECLIIFENKDKINEALKKYGGDILDKEEWYWSSSENDANRAWAMNIDCGGTCTNLKSGYNYVRYVMTI